jgi:major membrane immunogen (membrane-anchored lipoprotein)
MGIMAMLFSASLILSACGGSDGTDTDPAQGDVPVVPDEGGIDDSEGITETE